jgi:hypothetical protein
MEGFGIMRFMLLAKICSSVGIEYDDASEQWCESKSREVADYAGNLKNGKPHGYGIMFTSAQFARSGSMTTYSGMWNNGRFHGKGTLEWIGSSHSHKYSDGFKNGKKHGYGHETALGWEYRGRYADDEMIGEAKEWI